jgi:hypothetical protein
MKSGRTSVVAFAAALVTHFIVRTVEGDQKAVRQAGTPAPAR